MSRLGTNTSEEKLLPSPVYSHVTFGRLGSALSAPHSVSYEGLLQRATNVPKLRNPLEGPLVIHLTLAPSHRFDSTSVLIYFLNADKAS